MPEDRNPCYGKIMLLQNQVGLLHPAIGHDHRMNEAIKKIIDALGGVMECHIEQPV